VGCGRIRHIISFLEKYGGTVSIIRGQRITLSRMMAVIPNGLMLPVTILSTLPKINTLFLIGWKNLRVVPREIFTLLILVELNKKLQNHYF